MIEKSKPVKMYLLTGEFICIFENLRSAADFMVENGHLTSYKSAKSAISAIIHKTEHHNSIKGLFTFEYAT